MILPLKQDDLVVTPLNHRAQVINVSEDGFASIRYLSGPDAGKEGTCHERLLARMRKGREAPPPVRIGRNGKRA